MSYFFNPSALIHFWLIDYMSFSTGINIILAGIIAVLFSVFILAPIVFRSLDLINDQKINDILLKVANRYGIKKLPGIYRIRTAQINAINYSFVNKCCIGLTAGMLDAYRDKQLNDEDFEYVFAYILFQQKSHNDFKRNLVYGIASFYKSISYINLFFGWGFLRMAIIIDHKISRLFSYILGYFFVLVGIFLRVPEKLGSILAAPLIFKFQENADLNACKIVSPTAIKKTLKKIYNYNHNISQNLTILPEPEHWLFQPVRLLKIDQLFLFRSSFEKRIQQLSHFKFY